MSKDLNNDNVLKGLVAIGESTSNFSATVTKLAKIIPSAVNLLQGQIKSLKDTITQKDTLITSKDAELALNKDTIGGLEEEVDWLLDQNDNLTMDLEVICKKIHNAQSAATCYQKHKTGDHGVTYRESKATNCHSYSYLFKQTGEVITTILFHTLHMKLTDLFSP